MCLPGFSRVGELLHCTDFKRELIAAAVALEISKSNDLYLPKFFLRYRAVSGVH